MRVQLRKLFDHRRSLDFSPLLSSSTWPPLLIRFLYTFNDAADPGEADVERAFVVEVDDCDPMFDVPDRPDFVSRRSIHRGDVKWPQRQIVVT